MNNSEVSIRLLDFIMSLGISTSSFAHKCKVSEKTLFRLTEKQQGILYKIYQAYPQLNPYWLERGGGTMLKQDKQSIKITDENAIAEVKEKIDKSNIRKTRHRKMNTEVPIRDRLLLYINYLSMTVKDFATSCLLTESSIYTIDNRATTTTLNKICTTYPRLNPIWLQTGNGEMERLTDAVESYRLNVLKTDNKRLTEQLKNCEEQISRLLGTIEEKDKMIAKLIEKL